MYEKFGQFIDGKWQQSSSGETYEAVSYTHLRAHETG